MITNKTSIIYLAQGSTNLHRQAIFSILTLLYHTKESPKNFDIVIYTDNKEIFMKNLNGIIIKYEELSPSLIDNYLGNYNFPLRLKICVIQDCIKKYKSNILFVDADTYYLNNPVNIIDQISNSSTIFHLKEFTLIEGDGYYAKKVKKLVNKYSFNVQGENFKISLNTEMWNSGVLGISRDSLSLVKNVLELTDDICRKVSYYLAEQFAFSYIFQKNSALIPSNEVIYHYWYPNLKEIYNFHIERFLLENYSMPLPIKSEMAVELTKRQQYLVLPNSSKRYKLILKGFYKSSKKFLNFIHLSLKGRRL